MKEKPARMPAHSASKHGRLMEGQEKFLTTILGIVYVRGTRMIRFFSVYKTALLQCLCNVVISGLMFLT